MNPMNEKQDQGKGREAAIQLKLEIEKYLNKYQYRGGLAEPDEYEDDERPGSVGESAELPS